jgi:hypothetical protein
VTAVRNELSTAQGQCFAQPHPKLPMALLSVVPVRTLVVVR